MEVVDGLLQTRIAGVAYRLDKKESSCGEWDGYLEREPDNEYDKNAIKVCRKDGKHIGELDATAGDAFESNHSPASPYSGRQRHNYNRGYTMGYEAGIGEYKSL